MKNELTTEQVAYETTDAICSLIERLELHGKPMARKPEDIQNLEKCLIDTMNKLHEAMINHRLEKKVLGE